MNTEMNMQDNSPKGTGFPVPPTENVKAGTPVIPQSENGKWVPVDMSTLNFAVNGDMNRPMMGPDGAYYCISNSMPEYGSIYANQNTAVPTPASIVQLPPIVQPIALVPFASQNQPLLQYDPNYRPAEPETPIAPKYRLKPYRGVSFVQVLCSVAILALMVLLTVVDGKKMNFDWTTYRATGLDCIYGLVNLFGLASMNSTYYTKLLKVNFADGLAAGFKADTLLSLCYMLIPIFTVLILLVAFILIIFYLVKLGKQKTPRGFNAGAFIILCLSGSIIAMIFAISKRESMSLVPGITVYVAAALSLFMVILSFSPKKNAYIIDETALKRVYIINDPALANNKK